LMPILTPLSSGWTVPLIPLYRRSFDDWMKEVERGNRMRKQREKVMKEEEETRKRERPFYFYSRDQQAAYAKFERDFVRRIDHILENKVAQLFFECIFLVG
jgi:hypothetical protein